MIIDNTDLRSRVLREQPELHKCEDCYLQITRREYVRDRSSRFFESIRAMIYVAPFYVILLVGFDTREFWFVTFIGCLTCLVAEWNESIEMKKWSIQALEFLDMAGEPLFEDMLLEHITEANQDAMRSILKECPTVRVVVTSLCDEGFPQKVLAVYWSDDGSSYQVLECPVTDYLRES